MEREGYEPELWNWKGQACMQRSASSTMLQSWISWRSPLWIRNRLLFFTNTPRFLIERAEMKSKAFIVVDSVARVSSLSNEIASARFSKNSEFWPEMNSWNSSCLRSPFSPVKYDPCAQLPAGNLPSHTGYIQKVVFPKFNMTKNPLIADSTLLSLQMEQPMHLYFIVFAFQRTWQHWKLRTIPVNVRFQVSMDDLPLKIWTLWKLKSESFLRDQIFLTITILFWKNICRLSHYPQKRTGQGTQNRQLH